MHYISLTCRASQKGLSCVGNQGDHTTPLTHVPSCHANRTEQVKNSGLCVVNENAMSRAKRNVLLNAISYDSKFLCFCADFLKEWFTPKKKNLSTHLHVMRNKSLNFKCAFFYIYDVIICSSESKTSYIIHQGKSTQKWKFIIYSPTDD